MRAAGSLAASRQRWDQAIRMWTAAEASSDGGPSCSELALAALQKLKHPADVAAACAAIRKAIPRDPIGWRLEATIAAAQQDWARAAELWQACVSRFADRPDIAWYGELVAALKQQQRWEDMTSACAQMRELWPNDPQGWLIEGRVAVAREDWGKACELLHETVIRTKGGDEAYRRAELAVALTRNGAVDDASTEFKLANDIAQRHRNPRAMAAVSRALQSAGRTSWALSLCSLIRQQFPDDAIGWVVGGGLASAQGRWRQAAYMLNEASQRGGMATDLELNERHARALIRAGRFADAAIVVERLKGLQPQGPLWLAATVALLMAQGDSRAALDQLKQQQKLPSFSATFTPDSLAQLALEAGLSRPEALDTVSPWVGTEVCERAVEKLFDVQVAASEEVLKIAARDPKPVGFASYKLWRQSARRLLWAFLRDRRSEIFDAFAEIAIQYANIAELEAVRRIARLRFPKSRMRLAIDQMVEPKTQPANTAEQQFVSRWRNQQPAHEASIAAQLTGHPHRRLVCVVPVRDEEDMLPRFFAHYRALGVESFIVIDNGSKSSPLEVIGPLDGAEVTVVNAPSSFGGAHHGVGWFNEILEAGLCDWMLLADADEMLIYPGSDSKPLPALLNHMEARGEDAFTATMLDVYDRSFVRTGVPSPDIREHTLFYANHETRRSLESPYTEITGGLRRRPHLRKVPLIRAAAGIRRTSNHSVTAVRPAETTGALIHYKILRDREFMALSNEEVVAHPRIRDRDRYEMARHLRHRRLEQEKGSPFHAELSEGRLLRLGYMKADQAWRGELATAFPADRSPSGQQSVSTLAKVASQQTPAIDVEFQPSFEQIVDGVKQLIAAGQHAEASALLQLQLQRIGPSSVRTVVLVYVAVLTGRVATAQRLLASLRRRARREAADTSATALARIASALSELTPEIAREIVAMAEAALRANPLELGQTVQVYALSGHSHGIFALVPNDKPDVGDPAFARYMAVLVNRREWNRFQEALQSALAGSWGGADRILLDLANQYPHSAERNELLKQMAERLTERAEELNDTGSSFYLAVLHLLDRRAEFETMHRLLAARLPPVAALYFKRLIALRNNEAPMNEVWGLGLSRTGTSSLHTFMLRQGKLSAHWTNKVLGTLLSREDLDLFDFVDDIPVVWFCRKEGLPAGRRAIVTTRDFESWSRSIERHYADTFAREEGRSFDVLKASFEERVDFKYGQAFRDIQEETYFRFSSLREAYDYHRDWIATLARSSPVLELRVEADNKNELLSEFLDLSPRAGSFPHVNRAKT